MEPMEPLPVEPCRWRLAGEVVASEVVGHALPVLDVDRRLAESVSETGQATEPFRPFLLRLQKSIWPTNGEDGFREDILQGLRASGRPARPRGCPAVAVRESRPGTGGPIRSPASCR